MSQRKQLYNIDQMVQELLRMDSQIIHGSDFFKQVADHLESTRAENVKMERVAYLTYHSQITKCISIAEILEWTNLLQEWKRRYDKKQYTPPTTTDNSKENVK